MRVYGCTRPGLLVLSVTASGPRRSNEGLYQKPNRSERRRTEQVGPWERGHNPRGDLETTVKDSSLPGHVGVQTRSGQDWVKDDHFVFYRGGPGGVRSGSLKSTVTWRGEFKSDRTFFSLISSFRRVGPVWRPEGRGPEPLLSHGRGSTGTGRPVCKRHPRPFEYPPRPERGHAESTVLE